HAFDRVVVAVSRRDGEVAFDTGHRFGRGCIDDDLIDSIDPVITAFYLDQVRADLRRAIPQAWRRLFIIVGLHFDLARLLGIELHLDGAQRRVYGDVRGLIRFFKLESDWPFGITYLDIGKVRQRFDITVLQL